MDGHLTACARPALSEYAERLLTELRDIFVNRGASYSDFDDNSRLCQGMRRVLTGGLTTAVDDTTANGVEMIRHKLSRLAATGWHHRDSWLDLAGYALLIAASQDRAIDMDAQIRQGVADMNWQHDAVSAV